MRMFYVANVPLNAIRENKILTKISEFRVLLLFLFFFVYYYHYYSFILGKPRQSVAVLA